MRKINEKQTLTLNLASPNHLGYCLWWGSFLTLKRQPHKMIKHTQAIRRQIADELLECV